MLRRMMTLAAAALLTLGSCLAVLPACPGVTVRSAEAAESGTFGAVQWQYENHCLTLSGSGSTGDAWTHYDSSVNQTVIDTPWYARSAEIETIIVGEGVTEIGKNLFGGMDALKQLTLPGTLRSIGGSALQKCTALETLTLPAGVETLGVDCFAGCTALTSVSCPASLQTLGDRCFINCTALAELHLEGDVVRFGNDVFRGAEQVLEQQGDFSVLDGRFLYRYNGSSAEVTVPEGITQICTRAFAKQRSLKTVLLPDSLQCIGENAFLECVQLAAVVLPEALRRLDSRAFYNCTMLKAVSVPAALEAVGAECFSYCPLFPAEDAFLIVGGKVLVGVRIKERELVLPDGVRVLADDALQNNETVFAVRCPDSLRYIGAEVFAGCSRLMEVTLNDHLAAIGADAFMDCTSLLTLTVPASVQRIGDADPRHPPCMTQIYGVPGTAAEGFANRYRIPFAADPPRRAPCDLTLDCITDVWQFGNDGAVFGDGYYLSDADLAAVQAFVPEDDPFYTKPWSGSCFGMSLTVILAKNGLLPFRSLSELEPTEDVISMIHYYHAVQFSAAYSSAKGKKYTTAEQKFFRLLNDLRRVPEGGSPALLEFRTGGGLHAVAAFGVEDGSWELGGQTYTGRILVWDPNTKGFDARSYWYFNEQYDWYIPLYDLHGEAGEGIISACSDLNALTVCPRDFAVSLPAGDADCDGAVTAADAALLRDWLCGRARLSAFAQCDLNADGSIDARDLTALLRLTSGKEKNE